MSKEEIGNQLEDIANRMEDEVTAKQLQGFSDKAKIASMIEQKRKKYEEQNFADKDFEKTIDAKFVKIWLPTSVFVQQTLLSIAAKVFSSGVKDIDEEAKLTERFYKAVCSHMQIDSKAVNPELLDLGELQGYALLYWVELLAPLSAWGDVKAIKAILN